MIYFAHRKISKLFKSEEIGVQVTLPPDDDRASPACHELGTAADRCDHPRDCDDVDMEIDLLPEFIDGQPLALAPVLGDEEESTVSECRWGGCLCSYGTVPRARSARPSMPPSRSMTAQ